MSKRWTEDNDAYLRAYAVVGAFHMARDLGRSEAAIRQRCAKIGLSLDPADPHWQQIEREFWDAEP